MDKSCEPERERESKKVEGWLVGGGEDWQDGLLEAARVFHGGPGSESSLRLYPRARSPLEWGPRLISDVTSLISCGAGLICVLGREHYNIDVLLATHT